MLKRLRCMSILAVMATASATAQQLPSFEVASVKPSLGDPAPFRNVIWAPGGRMTVTGLTLRELVRSAYVGDGIQLMTQIVGGPSWIDTDRFDILAKLEGVPPEDPDEAKRQRSAMLKSLLADRFALKLHADTRALTVFDLVLLGKDGRLGPQLKISTCNRQAPPSSLTSDGRPCVPFRLVGIDPTIGITMRAEGITMPEFAAALVGFPEIDRPIRDRTGPAGAFDVQLTLGMPVPSGQSLAGGAPNPNASIDSGILTALPEQLGLKLEGRRDQTDVIVIDSVERPTAD